MTRDEKPEEGFAVTYGVAVTYDPLDSVRERVTELEEQVRSLTLFAVAISLTLYYALSKVVFRDELPKGA